eukprot:scaffold4233_cov180-Ochromonas_danica.AAC.7
MDRISQETSAARVMQFGLVNGRGDHGHVVSKELLGVVDGLDGGDDRVVGLVEQRGEVDIFLRGQPFQEDVLLQSHGETHVHAFRQPVRVVLRGEVQREGAVEVAIDVLEGSRPHGHGIAQSGPRAIGTDHPRGGKVKGAILIDQLEMHLLALLAEVGPRHIGAARVEGHVDLVAVPLAHLLEECSHQSVALNALCPILAAQDRL